MKSAEQWARELDHAQLHWRTREKPEVSVEYIKAIQHDAWREGMSRAEQICSDYQYTYSARQCIRDVRDSAPRWNGEIKTTT